MNKNSEQLLHNCVVLFRWMIFLQIVTLIFLGFKFRLSTRIERDVVEAQVKTEQVELHLIRHINATVERWNTLRQENPALSVPTVTPTP